MSNHLDLVLLAAGKAPVCGVYARIGDDLVTSSVTCGAALRSLEAFRARLAAVARSGGPRPSATELHDFGVNLFNHCFTGEVRDLYRRLAGEDVRLRIVSNQPQFQALPWEYLQEPAEPPGPQRHRSVVRIVPTIGDRPGSGAVPDKLRVLFASADPVDQSPVSWEEVHAALERAFSARVSPSAQVDLVEGTTRHSLAKAIQGANYDVFHFSGHGEVGPTGEGQLLMKGRAGAAERVSARQLAMLLGGRGIQLVVLSACETGDGDFAKPFAVIASTLVKAGIPAVVANQFAVPDKTVAAFVGRLYATLLDTGDIDLAVAEGRVALAFELASDSDDAVLEWGIPVLYRHIAGNKVFE